MRNDAFDANNFFNNRAGRAEAGLQAEPVRRDPRRADRQGQDVLLRRLPGLRINAGQTYLSTVPTLKMRNGDFSEINRVIYDPLTGQPFPGNIIPHNRFDPASANVFAQLYPEPNTAGTISANGQNDQQLPDQPDADAKDNQIDFKIDHVLTDEQPLLLPLQQPEDAARTCRRRCRTAMRAHLRCRHGDIKAQSLAFNDTHTFARAG